MSYDLQHENELFPQDNYLQWLVLILTFCLGMHNAMALNPSDVSLENRSGPHLLLDANNPCGEGPEASYIAFRICNTGNGTLTGLSATITGLQNGYSLLNGQPSVQPIESLAPGACAMVFWYIGFPCTFNQSTPVTITVSDSNPGTKSATFTMSTSSNLTASAGGLIISMTPGPEIIRDSTTWFDMLYEFGNIPKNGIAYFQPAGNLDFDAGCLQMTGFTVLNSDIPNTIPAGNGERLYYIAPEAAGGGLHQVLVRYYFKVVCDEFVTVLQPFAAATSGNSVKYSSNYGSVQVEVPDDFIPLPTPCSGNPDEFVIQKIGSGTGLESSGDNWSASWGDYNGDGFADLFVTTYDENQPNDLYRNNGDGSFTKINTPPFSNDRASSISSSWGDYDNDGDPDLYVGNNIGQANFLYRNEGNGSFTRIISDPAVSYTGYSHGVSWADYDNDGFLDLFVATYWETAFNLLYHNNGDGTFSEATPNPITKEASRSVCGIWGDYDNDGYSDLFVANTNNKPNSLYRNLGNGNFQQITSGPVVSDLANSVGASWGDYNNDGYLDLFVTNAGNEVNFLYRNLGNGTFARVTQGSIATDKAHSHGSAWVDFDNDGDLDLFVANDGQANIIYRNNGDATFSPLQNQISRDGGLSFGAAWADYDRDGDQDLFVANRQNTSNFLYENIHGQCKHWTCIHLTGTLSNASAIGASVKLYARINGQSRFQMKALSAQSGGGTGGQSEMTLHFGLGDTATIDSIVVVWPSGYQQVLTNQPVDQCLSITEDYASEVCGTVFYDANNNCLQDADENGIPGLKISLQPGNNIAFTDDQGHYSAYVRPGFYTIQEWPGANWSPFCPNTQGSRTVQVTGIGNRYCGNDFANQALCARPDLASEIASTAYRIGSEVLVLIRYENKGAVASTGTSLDVVLPASLELVETSLPFESQTGNSYHWELRELSAGQSGSIYLTCLVLSGTGLGETIQVTSRLSSQETDCDSSNDDYTEMAMAVASFDPNDLLVNPEGGVQEDQWIQYKIRFQNVGNATAARVRVVDELPAQLDLSTFEMGMISHTYRFQSFDHHFEWIFPNIDLPDSLRNEPGSHGFITFRAKLLPGIKPGEVCTNQALIYFDNLQPVATNSVQNWLVTSGHGRIAAKPLPLRIFPNPASEMVNIQYPLQDGGPDSYFTELVVYDLLALPVIVQQQLHHTSIQLPVGKLAPGTYAVTAIDNHSRFYTGRMVIVSY